MEHGRAGPIVVVGDVINDIIVRPQASVTVDSDTNSHIAQHPGGSAANVASWLGHVGAPVRFFGRVGTMDADVHRAVFADTGVDARLTVDDQSPTGTIVVVVDGEGRRTMYTDRGANTGLRTGDVPPGAVETAAILHVSGYALVAPDARLAASELIDRAVDAGITVSVDPNSAAFIAELGVATFRSLIRRADVLVPNLDEGRLLTGRHDPHDVVTELAGAHAVVALTMGIDGVLVAADGAPPVHVPAAPVREIDPTGAGDAFCAGFLNALRAGTAAVDDAVDAAGEGAALAAEAVVTVGARPQRFPTPVLPTRGDDR